jgi:hypothetical protein
MFRDQSGHLCADAEAIAERIKNVSDTEIQTLPETKRILRNALGSFDAKLLGLPQRERDATVSLFYKEVTNLLFDFQLSLVTRASREKIVNAQMRGEKLEALREFRATVENLGTVYGV